MKGVLGQRQSCVGKKKKKKEQKAREKGACDFWEQLSCALKSQRLRRAAVKMTCFFHAPSSLR